MHLASTMKPTANLLKIRLFAVAMGLLISASLTQAALIDNGGFTTDTATGLDWLDMYHTQGNTYNQTLAEISTGELVGWRFATSAEFDGLISAAGVGGSYTEWGYYQAILSEMVTLTELLGSSWSGTTSEIYQYSFTMGYVDPAIGSSHLAGPTYGYLRQFGYDEAEGGGFFSPEITPYERDDPSEYFGSFLVRANSVPDTGSTAALLGVGVAALAFARRKLG